MPARLFALSVQSVEFPFLTMDMQRTSIAQDVPDTPKAMYSTPTIVRPQAMILYNALPCTEGYDSLDVTQVFFTPNSGTFQSAYSFYDSSGVGHLIGIGGSKIWLADEGTTQWYQGVSGMSTSVEYTRFHLNGQNFIYAATHNVYHFDSSSLVTDVVTGISLGSILGFTASAGYAIAYDETTIYYTTNITESSGVFTFDFTPLLGTSGSEKIQDLKGIIVCILPIQNGFIVYSNENAVAGMYAANPDQPFNLAEIQGSSGVKSQLQVAYDQNVGFHFAWTKTGIQKIAPTSAQNMFPEVYDFINKRTRETLNPATGTFSRTVGTAAYTVRLKILGKRYLTISYGINDTNFPQNYYSAVIYDVDLQRWGKIGDSHVDIFEYNFVSAVNYLTYNDEAAVTYNSLAATSYAQMVTGLAGKQIGYDIALLQSDGSIYTYRRSNMADTSNMTSTSFILFGRVQFYTLYAQEIQTLECESFSGHCTIFTSVAENPKSTEIVDEGTDITNKPNLAGYTRRFGFRSAGRYQNILFQGKFHLTTIACMVSRNGSR